MSMMVHDSNMLCLMYFITFDYLEIQKKADNMAALCKNSPLCPT